jgi:hypothetical protein
MDQVEQIIAGTGSIAWDRSWLGILGLLVLFGFLGLIRLMTRKRDPSHDPD